MVTGKITIIFPLYFPFTAVLELHNPLYKRLHSGGAVLLHGLRDVPINVQGKGGGSVAQVPLDGLDIVPGPDGVHGEGMPLWHNKDKSGSPCVARSWRFALVLFPLKNGLKTGAAGGDDNQGLHLKDKFFQTDKEAKNGLLGYHNEGKRLRPGPAGHYRNHATESGGLLHLQRSRYPRSNQGGHYGGNQKNQSRQLCGGIGFLF